MSPTLNTQDRHAVVIAIDQQSGKGNCNYMEDIMPTLLSDSHGTPHAVCIALEGNGSRPSHMGKGFSEDGTMYTLNTIEQHSVCYSVDCRNLETNKELSATLQTKETGGWSLNYLNPVMYENEK